MPKAMLIATSCRSLPGSNRRIGVALSQFGGVRSALLAHGWQVRLSSPAGGAVPVDAGSWSEEWASAADGLTNSVALCDLGGADVDAWVVLGGHGALVDLTEDAVLAHHLTDAAESGHPLLGIDHGAAALAAVRTETGLPLIAGRRVTGRSDSEERDVRHHRLFRPTTEQRLRAAGGRYFAGPAWQPYAVSDGPVITAQNPASVPGAMRMLLEATYQRLEAA